MHLRLLHLLLRLLLHLLLLRLLLLCFLDFGILRFIELRQDLRGQVIKPHERAVGVGLELLVKGSQELLVGLVQWLLGVLAEGEILAEFSHAVFRLVRSKSIMFPQCFHGLGLPIQCNTVQGSFGLKL